MNKRLKLKKEIKLKDKTWALEVKARDKACIVCGSTKKLNAHHIIPREIKEFRWWLVNGVSLCGRHHKFDLNISAHRNPFAFFMFMEKNYPNQIQTLKNALLEKNADGVQVPLLPSSCIRGQE